MRQGEELHPGPLAELDFWQSKAENLNSIFQQLQGEKIRRVLRFLDTSKSTYNLPFAKLCKEVFHTREEANNNHKYLRPLRKWFEKLDTEPEFTAIVDVFRPMMHLILLVWKSSTFYNTPARLVVLMREVCSAIIRRATKYLNGEKIKQLIDAEEPQKAVGYLQTILRVCGTFKSTYFDYKAKANSECPGNQWRVQNNALFIRLDSFLERCHDILDLMQTLVQFSKLAKIEVGGTKGKTLTTSVQQIYSDFQGAVQAIYNVPYDITNIDAKAFDDDFYEFRSTIKELERRLASVLAQGFDDCATVSGRFKLLDSFEGLLERAIIADELEKKHSALIGAYAEDLATVQQLFVENKDDPVIPNNLPPIAGALSWSRGLLERIRLPMDKLKRLNKTVVEREDAKEAVKTYTTLVASLAEYANNKIVDWGHSIEASSQAKLKLPLLRREEGSTMLNVNFDPALVRLLREVKYFLLLELDVPDTALQIYRKAEVFRRQTGNLDLIVNMYNGIQTTLLPVERPLVKNHLLKIDRVLSQGLRQLNWKSHGIDVFLTQGMADVRETNNLLTTMKSNLRSVVEILEGWLDPLLMQRKSKPCSKDEFEEAHHSIRQSRYMCVKEGGNKIHHLLKDTCKSLKVSQGAPDWKAYVDFANNIVVGGLVEVVLASSTFLLEQIDPGMIIKEDKMPILDIELDLYGKDVIYIPSQQGVNDLVWHWVDRFLHCATVFKRVDQNQGHYLKEVLDHPHILHVMAKITSALEVTESQLDEWRSEFMRYEYLWTTDLGAIFDEFLETAFLEIPKPESGENDEQQGEGDDAEPEEAVQPLYIPLDLPKFDERIQHFLDLQTEIQDLKHSNDITFLRVNSQPIKQALSTWVTKWVYMYTQYLHEHVTGHLTDLCEFMQRVNTGLAAPVDSSDRDALMNCMKHIRDVRKRIEDTQDMFAPLRDTVSLLRNHGINFDLVQIDGMDVTDFLESAPMRWDNVVNTAFKKKEVIQPLQNQMGEQIKSDIVQFGTELKAYIDDFHRNAPFNVAEMSGLEPIETAYATLAEYEGRMAAMEQRAEEFAELEELFELAPTRFTNLKEARVEIKLLKMSLDMGAKVLCTFDTWRRTLWAAIDTDDLLDETKKMLAETKKLPKQMRAWEVYMRVEDLVKNMVTVLPLVNELHSPAMRDRHWKSLMQVTQKHFEKGAHFALDDVLQLQLHEHVEACQDIVEVAAKELKIESRLKSIESMWASTTLTFRKHGDSDVSVVQAPDEAMESLEEHQLQLQTMIGMGKFVDYFRDRVVEWQTKLGNVETTLKLWLSVQKQWASLESIFLGSEDIRAQLPDDAKRFEGIDSDFKELMAEAVTVPMVVAACVVDGRESALGEMHGELEICQKSLNEYLEVKKNIFPRFYFVSNVALLDILSNGNNPPKIQPHFGACFDSVQTLVFEPVFASTSETDADGKAIVPIQRTALKMISKDGETVAFHGPFEMLGAVESWLNELVRHVQDCLRSILAGALETAANWEVDKPRDQWVNDFCAQLVLLASQIYWTEETETALEELENGQEDALKMYSELCNGRLEALITLVQGELTREQRTKIITLITIDVHSRDIVQKLIDTKIESKDDFLWQSQLRYYWEEDERDTKIHICDFRSQYSYEYTGNSGRLCITPLTDRCYVTLTTALRLMLGGAPAGPAGTGKTETTKDLARGMGLMCYVFNCSDQMNYQTMAGIFKGLSQTGAWGCFDEFNRIPIEVLSVVATQVKSVLDAIIYLSVPENRDGELQNLPAGTPPVKVGTFDFSGEEISLIPTTGFFITMNPGYAGRTELPENLKALFRSCAMIRPDLKPICENMLMAEGFIKARQLAVKFVTLYQLEKLIECVRC